LSGLLAHVDDGLLGIGFLILFFVVPHALAGDDFTRYADIQQLLEHGRLTDSKYSLVMRSSPRRSSCSGISSGRPNGGRRIST